MSALPQALIRLRPVGSRMHVATFYADHLGGPRYVACCGGLRIPPDECDVCEVPEERRAAREVVTCVRCRRLAGLNYARPEEIIAR